MMNVYYWWHVDTTEAISAAHVTPQDTLMSILIDLSEEQQASAMSAIHDAFNGHCFLCLGTGSGSHQKCMDFYQDMDRVAPEDGHEDKDGAALPHIVRPFVFTAMMQGAFHETRGFGDSYDPGPTILEMLKDYNIQRLLDAGLSDIESLDAPNVLDHEIDRRILAGFSDGMVLPYSQSEYEAFYEAGGDLDGYIRKVAEDCADDEDAFVIVMSAFEDVPDDAQGWSIDKKRALARRLLFSMESQLADFEVTRAWKNDGVLPHYLYRFQDAFPSSEPI